MSLEFSDTEPSTRNRGPIVLIRLLVDYQADGSRYRRGDRVDLPRHIAGALVNEGRAEIVPMRLTVPGTPLPTSRGTNHAA
jgi:hypothetical protein